MDSLQKHRETISNALKTSDFQSLPKEFLQAIMILLEINDFKQMNLKNVVDRILAIYQSCKGNFDKYLNQKKFTTVHGQLKEYVWNIFKKLHESIVSRKPNINRNQFHGMAPEMNMNMFNMFLNVPKLDKIQEIQFFQRKMYEICKKSMPQVLHNLSMGSNKRMPMYRSAMNPNLGMNYQQQGHDFDYSPQPQPYSQFYPNSNSYMNMKKQMGMANNMQTSQMRNQGGFPFLFKDDQPEEYRNRPIFSHDHIKSPRDQDKRAFLSQQNINYNSDIPSFKNKIANEGFTYYGKPQKQSPEIPKVPKFINNYHLEHNQQLNNEPRKQVKRDYLESEQIQSPPFTKTAPIISIPSLTCKCTQKESKCDYCKISKIDLFHETENLLTFFYTKQDTKEIQFQVDLKTKQALIMDNDNYDIQIRSIKTSGSILEICWPENLKIFINNEEMIDFYEENKRSKNKKSSECSFLLSKEEQVKKYETKMPLKIKIHHQNDKKEIKDRYLIAVFFVKKLSIQKLTEQIKKNIETEDYLMKISEKSPQISKIVIKPIDELTKQIIDDPVRGKQCDHAECFDLNSFLQYEKYTKVRSWKCPICKKPIQEFILDKRIQEVLSDVKIMISVPIQIIIFKDGGYKPKFQEQKKQKIRYQNEESEKRQLILKEQPKKFVEE